MKTIYKYQIEVGVNSVLIPEKAEFLSFGLDAQHKLCVWYLIEKNTLGQSDYRKLTVVGTGNDLADDEFYASNYLGTVTSGYYVWHLFRD